MKTVLKGFWRSALVWNSPPNGIIYPNDLLSSYPDGHISQGRCCQLCAFYHVFSPNKCHCKREWSVLLPNLCVRQATQPGLFGALCEVARTSVPSLCSFCGPKTLASPTPGTGEGKPKAKRLWHLPSFIFLRLWKSSGFKQPRESHALLRAYFLCPLELVSKAPPTLTCSKRGKFISQSHNLT